MYELNDKQIALVYQEVESAGINFSHLGTDLMDHVCCDIEHHMSQGISFNQAHSMVKEDFGIKGLRQIQQETLMLIDKNYRIMKNSMKTIGVLALSLMAFGVLFKIFHWPGASIMLTVSFFFTGLVFFPSMLYVMYKEVNKKKQSIFYVLLFLGGIAFMAGSLFKIMHFPGASLLFLAGIGIINYIVLPLSFIQKIKEDSISKKLLSLFYAALIIFISGLLFKINHWPGAALMLTFGSLILVVGAVPYYYHSEIKHSPNLRIDFLFGIIALTYFVVLSFLLAINTSKIDRNNLSQQSISYHENASYFHLINQSVLDTCSNQNLLLLNQVSNNLLAQIKELKISVVQHRTELDRASAEKALANKRTDIYSTSPVYFLLSTNNDYSPLPHLKTEVASYLAYLENLASTPPSTLTTMTRLLNTQNEGQPFPWEDYNFKHMNGAATLTTLSLWEYQIELNKHVIINNIYNPKN